MGGHFTWPSLRLPWAECPPGTEHVCHSFEPQGLSANAHWTLALLEALDLAEVSGRVGSWWGVWIIGKANGCVVGVMGWFQQIS